MIECIKHPEEDGFTRPKKVGDNMWLKCMINNALKINWDTMEGLQTNDEGLLRDTTGKLQHIKPSG